MNNFKHIEQQEENDCGIACLQMIFQSYANRDKIVKEAGYCGNGMTMKDISDTFAKFKIKSFGVQINTEKLKHISLPVIAHVHEDHFVIVYDLIEDNLFIADPAREKTHTMQLVEFNKIWNGYVLVF